MARFVFRYESLLKQRAAVEKDRQRELGVAVQKREAMLNTLRQTQQTIRQSKAELSEALSGQVDLSQIGAFSRYTGQTTADGHRIVRELAEVEKVIVFARGRLVEASKARKALELLKEKHLAAWAQERQRKETAELDDLAAQGFMRRQQDEGVAA